MELAWVYKLRTRGNYKDLCAKLGQELYQDLVKLSHLKGSVAENLSLQTDEGRILLEQITDSSASEKTAEQLLSEFQLRFTPAQKRLRLVCERMNFKNATSSPTWARGAHIFVLPAVADEIEDAFEEGELGKGDLVVSPELMPDIEEAMSTCLGSRRVCAYIHHASTSSQALGVFSAVDAHTIRGTIDKVKAWLESNDPDFLQSYKACSLYRIDLDPSRSARLTHSTGSAPRANKELVTSWGHSRTCVKRAAEDGLSLGPTLYKNFSLTHRESPRGGLAVDVASEQTSLTVDTIDLDQHTDVDIHEFMKSFEVRCRPTIKTESSFGEYARDHFTRFQSEVLHPLLETLPLEGTLAAAFNGDDTQRSECLTRGYKMLKSLAAVLYHPETLIMFFRASAPEQEIPDGLQRAFHESVDMLAKNMSEAIRREFKKLLREKRSVWENLFGHVSQDDGCHVAAEQLRMSFQGIYVEACSKAVVYNMAADVWTRQHKLHRQREKEALKAGADTPADATTAVKKKKFSKRHAPQRQGASDRKAGMQDEAYQHWDGSKVPLGSRPYRPGNVLRA